MTDDVKKIFAKNNMAKFKNRCDELCNDLKIEIQKRITDKGFPVPETVNVGGKEYPNTSKYLDFETSLILLIESASDEDCRFRDSVIRGLGSMNDLELAFNNLKKAEDTAEEDRAFIKVFNKIDKFVEKYGEFYSNCQKKSKNDIPLDVSEEGIYNALSKRQFVEMPNGKKVSKDNRGYLIKGEYLTMMEILQNIFTELKEDIKPYQTEERVIEQTSTQEVFDNEDKLLRLTQEEIREYRAIEEFLTKIQKDFDKARVYFPGLAAKKKEIEARAKESEDILVSDVYLPNLKDNFNQVNKAKNYVENFFREMCDNGYVEYWNVAEDKEEPVQKWIVTEKGKKTLKKLATMVGDADEKNKLKESVEKMAEGTQLSWQAMDMIEALTPLQKQ